MIITIDKDRLKEVRFRLDQKHELLIQAINRKPINRNEMLNLENDIKELEMEIQ